MNSELKTRMPMPMPMPPSAARITDALQPAPVDVSYGEGGYSHVESHDPCTVRFAPTFARAISIRGFTMLPHIDTGRLTTTMAALSGSWTKRNSRVPFASFNDYLSNQTFTPTQLVEDPDNKSFFALAGCPPVIASPCACGDSMLMVAWIRVLRARATLTAKS